MLCTVSMLSLDFATMPTSSQEKAVVHVVDDDASVRRALENLFETIDLETRTYATGQEFLAAPVPDRPGCLVIDIRLPDTNGIEFHGRLIQQGVRLPVVMLTGYGDIPMSVRAMKAGALDFLTKPFRDQDMLDAVMAAITRDRERRKADHDVSQVQQRFETLSPRERQVMLGVVSGKMNKQVAGDLGISEITVKIHRGAAMRKMSAKTLTDLVRMADVIKPRGP